MKTDEPKLPESLTRFLAAPPADGAAPASRPAEARLGPIDRRSAHQALESALLRGFVSVTSGLVWLLVLGLVLRHLAR
ncbi:hypothetical protein MKK67_27320 [Methylobacterium sp. J-072]|uniref:hypothetical protein n=1 Tax=Methylobacterium sp. J-072 TaxID=2836651 RepID=UPI001FB8E0C6|nr:hypothetical protein [Methylobacterium sp. J-072]MCJ2096180.1 hypothetical protein [Methylobacterium sp. J-072]